MKTAKKITDVNYYFVPIPTITIVHINWTFYSYKFKQEDAKSNVTCVEFLVIFCGIIHFWFTTRGSCVWYVWFEAFACSPCESFENNNNTLYNPFRNYS